MVPAFFSALIAYMLPSMRQVLKLITSVKEVITNVKFDASSSRRLTPHYECFVRLLQACSNVDQYLIEGLQAD